MNKEMKKKPILGMESSFKFGKFKGITIEKMLNERSHEYIHYLIWIKKEFDLLYTEEVQEELTWQNYNVPKFNYNKAKYWGYTF